VHTNANSAMCIAVSMYVRAMVHLPIPNYSSASKSISEGISGAELRLTTTVSQEHHDPLTNSSGRPDPTLIGLLVESGRNASCQPPRAYIYRLALGPPGLSIECPGPARSHARRLIRSNYALIPAPPGTTRATISCSDP